MPSQVKISGWLKSSFIDFPGTVAAVLFFSGCNLACPYCHNPSIVRGRTEPVSFDEVKSYILKHKGIIEGAVISGGEAALLADLEEISKSLREMGLKIKLDTNGLLPEKIEKCSPDYLALDIKTSFKKYALLGAAYPDCGERLRQSINIVKKMGDQAEVRITAAPGVIDINDVEELLVELSGVKKIYIQQFVSDYDILDPAYLLVKPYPAEELERWQAFFSHNGIYCAIR
ncbi:MAG: anaerobic ribonucleoside-triphosphate reductase activating protein [Chitinispirillales bacterium]|jgi:pyruvate formate lyase activating enzyme|nr:anaerobic ribonucleoside-triphosphate reductase activating protein [Chitinispirillales bacterium]